jgi:hypothetical protein
MFWVDIPPVNSNIGISDIKKIKNCVYLPVYVSIYLQMFLFASLSVYLSANVSFCQSISNCVSLRVSNCAICLFIDIYILSEFYYQ